MKSPHLTNVIYGAVNVGVIPILVPHVTHGFSWGKGSKNMSYRYGEKDSVAQAEEEFFGRGLFSRKNGTAVMSPEHGTKIVEVSCKDQSLHDIPCDCLITKEKHLTLTVKPADCSIVIITTPREHPHRFVALVHAGRKGVDQNLAEKTVKYIASRMHVPADELLIGIAPSITKKNYFIKHRDELENPNVWKGFTEERDNLFYLDMMGIIRRQFVEAGVRESNIMQYHIDTFDAAKNGEAFSHRYWKINKEGNDGRFMVAVELT